MAPVYRVYAYIYGTHGAVWYCQPAAVACEKLSSAKPCMPSGPVMHTFTMWFAAGQQHLNSSSYTCSALGVRLQDPYL